MENNRILNRKIEDRALTTLNSIIDDHPTMEAAFSKQDKNLSWDGYIRLYQDDNATSDKKNYDADVPVQIKGHVDKTYKYIGMDRIRYSISIDDLRVYFRQFGCLYFQIFMTEDGKERAVFYNALYPSKIKTYLRITESNRKQKSLSIPFVKLKQDARELELLCRQFSSEILMQGSGRGQIVERMIRMSDIHMVKNIQLKAVDARNPYDVLRRIATGDVVAYGEFESGGIKFPIGWGDKFTASMGYEIRDTVSVGDHIYYEKFRIENVATAPGEEKYSRDIIDRISLSPNLYFDFTEKGVTFQFSFKSDIMQISNDAEFVLELLDAGGFLLGDHPISFYGSNISDETRKQLRGVIEIGEVLRNIGCKIAIPFPQLSEEDKAQIDLLMDIKRGVRSFNTDKTVFVYDWPFHNHIFPFIVERKIENSRNKGSVTDECNLIEFMFSRTLKMSFGSPQEDNGEIIDTLPEDAYIVPNFVNLPAKKLADLYYYDYESMFDQVEAAVINNSTEGGLDKLSLELIAAYDINGDERLLEVSLALLTRLAEHSDSSVNYHINMLQIEKRLDHILSEESISRVQLFLDENYGTPDEKLRGVVEVASFCLSVLKDESEEAQLKFANIREEDRVAIEGFPIMTLYKKLLGTEVA